MFLVVVDVKPLEEYKLLLTFENGEKKVFNMKPYLDKGVFRELKEKKLFKTVRVSFDSVEWSNKADIEPEVLYEDSVEYI
ncbi:MAG: DUF2442 domain-containing protein [Clostridiales bacterium]|jgi:hypothetical protein|nr:DUF2442 domain-containing protein [Clostridiales bacterium]